MSVEIPSDLSPFVDAVIRSGHYQSEADAVAEALRLLRRREALAEDICVGAEQLDRGESVSGDQVFAELRDKAAALILDR
ncbi:MAG TPA: type II toxin-antitoxin system ParD family antitoxin [Pirellulaceae bacterium]|nr:type II toxin-antitoxin system ParD family antitoxin [Pirellulaceae bacterium]